MKTRYLFSESDDNYDESYEDILNQVLDCGFEDYPDSIVICMSERSKDRLSNYFEVEPFIESMVDNFEANANFSYYEHQSSTTISKATKELEDKIKLAIDDWCDKNNIIEPRDILIEDSEEIEFFLNFKDQEQNYDSWEITKVKFKDGKEMTEDEFCKFLGYKNDGSSDI
ncbi:MAG: hypothetical protein ABIJ17_02460 [Patescibacteria group bacterium]